MLLEHRLREVFLGPKNVVCAQDHIIVVGFHFHSLNDLLEFGLEIEVNVFAQEGSVEQRRPVLHVLQPEDDLFAQNDGACELRLEAAVS